MKGFYDVVEHFNNFSLVLTLEKLQALLAHVESRNDKDDNREKNIRDEELYPDHQLLSPEKRP